MALWEYKIIGSGKGGFGSPSLLESHLNQLGKDEWEIIAFNSHPENPLAFHGLARRTTQRDWTLQDAAAAAAKAEAEKLRAEFAAKFQAAQALAAGAPEDKPSTLVGETASPEDGLRSLRDTDHDQDPEALADNDDDDWKQLESEDELPTFFEFIRPHMRRNQRGPGMSLAVDYLANKIDQSPTDVVTALRECGFEIPEREDDDPIYLEYDGDLYWINTNRHHQLFINTKEKPRPVFRSVKAQVVTPPEKSDDRPARSEGRSRRPEAAAPADEAAPVSTLTAPESATEAQAAPASVAAEAPIFRPTPVAAPAATSGGAGEPPTAAEALMARLRPMMRRNRRGPGVSGSVSFLSRALKQSDQDLTATLAAAGFVVPAQPNDKPAFTEVGAWTYWLNKDSRGGLWINGRERRERDGRDRADRGGARDETSAASAESGESSPASPTSGAEAAVDPAAPTTPAAGADSAGSEATPIAQPEAAAAPAADSPVSEASPVPATTPTAEAAPPATPVAAEVAPAAEPVPTAVVPPSTETGFSLSAVRLLLKPKPRGTGASGELGHLSRALNVSEDQLLQHLLAAGLVLPVEGVEKTPALEVENELLWLQKSEKGGALWLNAKAKPARRPRPAGGSRRGPRKSAEAAEPTDTAESGAEESPAPEGGEA
ncbi:MAG: hypothetical protein U1F61_24030 [Opitutaceae bacterium]